MRSFVIIILIVVSVVVLAETPSGIRLRCSLYASKFSTHQHYRSLWNQTLKIDRAIYNNSFDNYVQGNRITAKEYLVLKYGSVEEAQKQLEKYYKIGPSTDDQEESLAETGRWHRGPSLMEVLTGPLEHDLNNLDEPVVAIRANLEQYNLRLKQHTRYINCIKDKNPAILSEKDQGKY